ncbi:U-box domain [Dillenia turbinata]|uniref:U-box domain-containing protein n=1 Tax=Dillenia turbinata TaxID=194707 RepID=A0AAN8UM81_9MAGN
MEYPQDFRCPNSMELMKDPVTISTHMEYPQDFRCPISIELMKDPVTISTGVTYDRKNIEKWFFTYKKKTCPATMQPVKTYDITPNHTLKRLILAWKNGNNTHCLQPSPSSSPSRPPPRPSSKHEEIVFIFKTIETTPFKLSSLKKLRSLVDLNDEVRDDFVRLGGVEVLVHVIVVQILMETSDFVAFRACEEALGILHKIPIYEESDYCVKILSKPECMKAMAIILQRGSSEARFYAVDLFRKLGKVEYDWSGLIQDQGIDFFKSLLELVSDDMCKKASSCALEVLIDILNASKKSRIKAIEAGAIWVLVELLPDSSGSKCEKILVLIKLLCKCADGRMALVEHELGIAAVSKKLLNVSDGATKMGVKILWLISSCHPSERVLEDMLVYGSVKKLLALLHVNGRSSTKDNALKMFKLHANVWKKFPCFPSELKDYLGLIGDV